MASEDGKIVLENTLDARLDVIFRQKLPQVYMFVLLLIILIDIELDHSLKFQHMKFEKNMILLFLPNQRFSP